MKPETTAINARAFGTAAGTIAGAVVVICSLAVALAPEATTAFAGYVVHVDLSGFSRTLNWGSFLAGLFFWTLGTGFVFGAAGSLYNRFSGHAPTGRPADFAVHFPR